MPSLAALMATLSIAAAVAVTTPASAMPDCITMDANPIPTVCQGGTATLAITLKNGCSESKRASLTFDLDKETIRDKGELVMEALESVQRQVLLPLSVSIPSGRHTVTIHLKDAAGNTSSTEVYLVVERCSNR